MDNSPDARHEPDSSLIDRARRGPAALPVRRRRPLAFVVVAVAALFVASCGGDTGTDGSSGKPSDSTVDLSGVEWSDHTDESKVLIQTRDNSYVDDYVIVKAGTPVTFRNVGRTDHNALPSDGVSFTGIEADELEPGDERVIVFEEPGDYPFYCSLHGTTTAGMIGAVRVVA